MGRKALGELEQQVLLALVRLGGESYSVPLVVEMEARSGQEVAQAAVFIVLRRLETKGLVSSRLGGAGPSRRTRRYFRIEPEGRARLAETRRLLDKLWDGVEAAVEER
jgi:DNA-binding PadR family transcriptional regulator